MNHKDTKTQRGNIWLRQLDETGAVQYYNTWSPDGLVARPHVPTGTTTWYQHDQQGNVIEGMNNGGALISCERYTPWGYDKTDPYGYNGKWRYYTDHKVGLILCGQRYYDPKLGRWLTEDPIGTAGGLNLYEYCQGKPVGLADPTGSSPGDAIDVLGIGLDIAELAVAPTPAGFGWLLLDVITAPFPGIPGTTILHHGPKLAKLLRYSAEAAAQVDTFADGMHAISQADELADAGRKVIGSPHGDIVHQRQIVDEAVKDSTDLLVEEIHLNRQLSL